MSRVCGTEKRFEPQPIAGLRAAIVRCGKTAGHLGAHEAIRNGTAFVWNSCECRDSNREGPIRPPGKDINDPTGLHCRYCPLY